MTRLEQEDDLIRKQTLQLGRLVIDFNAERGNTTTLCFAIDRAVESESRVGVSDLKETPTPGPICLIWTFV